MADWLGDRGFLKPAAPADSGASAPINRISRTKRIRSDSRRLDHGGIDSSPAPARPEIGLKFGASSPAVRSSDA
jgi:hypothetical protein